MKTIQILFIFFLTRYFISCIKSSLVVAWPSGKAEACKASIPSSNLGATFTLDQMLYIIATPIGNLKDITLRALESLQECDYILCEDTRHTAILLQHYKISKPLKSFHKHNEQYKEDAVIQDLQNGKKVALVSDAGTPGISDPGAKLIQRTIQEAIPLFTMPGPCAVIAALSSSGLNSERFQFIGFLPKKTGDLKQTLQEIRTYPGTTICYESPHRLIALLKAIAEILPNKNMVIARELTKKFEEIQRGVARDLLNAWQDREVKGEIVILIEGETTPSSENKWMELSPEEHVAMLEQSYGLTQHDAIKMAAEQRGVPKRNIYNKINQK